MTDIYVQDFTLELKLENELEGEIEGYLYLQKI